MRMIAEGGSDLIPVLDMDLSCFLVIVDKKKKEGLVYKSSSREIKVCSVLFN